MKHKGFTLIEVALFLALTGILFVGIVAGTNSSIARQRFYDSTQSFAEFLRSIYSQVSNPEGVGTGRGDLAIYGKMISFGQKYDLNGEEMPDGVQKIFVYDVVGMADVDLNLTRVDDDGNIIPNNGTATAMLGAIGANVAVPTAWEGERVVQMTVAGIVEAYEPRWGATIETTNRRNRAALADSNLYNGTILVVRHPVSGTINTLVSGEDIDVNFKVAQCSSANVAACGIAQNMLVSELDAGKFSAAEVNFCVNPGGLDYEAEERWNIRLVGNARNASGVETISLNDYSDGDGDSRNMCMPESL